MNAKVISVCNEKGGVGKSTIAVQVALELAERKFKVRVIDNDPSGDATTALFGQEIPSSILLGNVSEAVSNTAKLYTSGAQFEPIEVKENLFLILVLEQEAGDGFVMVKLDELKIIGIMR